MDLQRLRPRSTAAHNLLRTRCHTAHMVFPVLPFEHASFKQQAVMNKECNLVLGSFPLKLFFGTSRFVDCIIISSASQKKVDEKDRESNEVIKGIKELVEQQNQKYK